MANIGTAAVGTILQGAGLNSSPIYSTATYPATTNINQILYSSNTNTVSGISTLNNGVLITSSGGVPSMLADGTTGQVLTATTGAPPSWTSIPSSFAPNSTVQLYDDFIGTQALTGAASILSTLTWFISTTAAAPLINGALSTSANPGVLTLPPSGGAGESSGCGIFLGDANSSIYKVFFLGGGAITLNWIIRIVNLSVANPRYTLRLGLGDTANADQVNGVYFEYSDNENSGDWIGKTASASTRTSSNSNIAAGTSYVNLQIAINAAGTSATFSINGTPISGGAISTNIPSTGITPFLNIFASVGTISQGTILADLFYMTQTLTTPR